MTKKIKIALPASISKTQYYINQAYSDYVAEAGMFPVVITPGMTPELALSMCDGLLLPGGIDLDPIYYGEDNHTSYSVDPEKDAFERALFHTFREAGRPIFGICRGFQLIAREYLNAFPDMVEFIDFWTDIPQHQQTGSLSLSRTIHSHFVNISPYYLYNEGTKVPGRIPVNSMHHQCLYVDFEKEGVVGVNNFRMAAWTTRGLKIDAKDLKKGNYYPLVCEAFRVFDWGSPIFAVQWHPEELKDLALIRNFFTQPAEVNSKLRVLKMV
jgi:gamma-glutamyl-gamma-aminobutyrate hydrolase PuuD